jgi:uncharacterized protein DUF4058/DUF2934 family protein
MNECPFPGMDPYLEAADCWPKFHCQLVECVYHSLLAALSDRYRSAIGQRRFDVDTENHEESYLEIRAPGDDRLVTLVNVLSPANKSTAAGRQPVLEQRRQALDDGANLVEIDLILQGQPMNEVNREGLPKWDYAITVARATYPGRYEIYTATLRKQLPRFRLPLASGDRDTVLDLQAIFTRYYIEGDYLARLDYSREPPVPLADEDSHWLDALLTAKKLRAPTPSHAAIARAAYGLWEQDGRPHGRDKEHWYEALAQLRRVNRGQPGRE